MGSSSYSHSVFTSSLRSASAAPGGFYGHTAAVAAGTAAAGVHDDLDPMKKNKAGDVVRESRDSDNHPASTAVSVLFDITGSMNELPHLFVSKLANLMALLTKKGYISDPQILFGGIGDAYSDNAPLQVGQFESAEEMIGALSKVYLEGGGGGQTKESYELAMYFLARKAKMDCVEKRGKKGYLFITGDENPYSKVSKDQIKRIIGDTVEADIPLETILDDLREKFEVFWVFPKQGSYWDDKAVRGNLEKLFGQNLILMENADEVCEVIVAAIGVSEGYDVKSLEADLIDAGSTKAAAKNAVTALAPFVASSALTRKVGTLDGTLATGGDDTVERL